MLVRGQLCEIRHLRECVHLRGVDVKSGEHVLYHVAAVVVLGEFPNEFAAFLECFPAYVVLFVGRCVPAVVFLRVAGELGVGCGDVVVASFFYWYY